MVDIIKKTTFASTNPTTLLVARPADQGGTFLLYMEYTKQPITLAEQINILKQRGLIFENENEALSVLNHISYFRLASYWRVMEENSRIHRFRSGSRFSSVLTLYNFDCELRSLVFNALQHIEIASRTKINQHFAMTYGSFWFMDSTLAANEYRYNKNLESLRTELGRCRLNSINPQNTFVQDFKSLLKKYSSVQPAMMGFPRGWESEPLWQ